MNKKKRFFKFLLVVVIILIAYGLTLGMYFFQDDSALLFKLQHQEERAGFFGAGLFQRGTYQYVVVPFVPFFKIFGLNPLGYNLVGLFLYGFSVFVFYLFAKKLFQNKKFGYLATLFFAAGFIGSDSMFRVINYWSTNIGIILTLLSLWQFVKYLNKKILINYLLSLGFFLAAVELVYYRSHSIFVPIFFLDALITLFPFKVREIPKFILRQLPFIYIFKVNYLSGAGPANTAAASFFKNILTGKIEKYSSLFSSLGNVLVPDQIQGKVLNLFASKHSFEGTSIIVFLLVLFFTILLFKLFRLGARKIFFASLLLFGANLLNIYFYQLKLFWYQDIQSVIAGYLGMCSIIVVFFLASHIWKSKRRIAISLLLGEIIIISQIFGYHFLYLYSIFGTIHRYLSYSTIGYSLVAGSISILIFEKLARHRFLRILPIFIVVSTNLALGFKLQLTLLKERSIPARRFYQDIKRFVPEVGKGDVFYFDIADDSLSQRQFGDFFSVGSMPETTALAIYYGVDRYDLYRFTDYDEFLYYLSKNKTDLGKIHTFFYRADDGLIDTTSQTRNLLLKGSDDKPIDNLGKIDMVSSVPVLAKMQMNVVLIDKPGKLSPSPLLKGLNYTLDQKLKIFSYLKSRENYYRTVKISSESEWKYREIRNIIDGNSETPWQGHRLWWHDKHHDEVVADLGETRYISTVLWQNWVKSLSPTSYNFQISLNGKDWQKVYEISKGSPKENGQIVLDSFTPVLARFVKMEITDTPGGDSPAITEFEVVNSEYQDVNLRLALTIKDDPFSMVENNKEWNVLKNEIKEFAKLVVSWSTDKSRSNIVSLPIIIDSKPHLYEFVMPAGGTIINRMSFAVNIPAELGPYKLMMKSLSIKDIEDMGLIKEFKEN